MPIVVQPEVQKRKNLDKDLQALIDEILLDECEHSTQLLPSKDVANKSIDGCRKFPNERNEAVGAKSKTNRKTIAKSFYNDFDNNNNNVLIEDKTKTETQVNTECSAGQ